MTAADLIAAGRWMAARGFLPATSGNLSCRLSAGSIAITASGGDKGALNESEIINPEGWVAQFTGDPIAARFPTHDEALARLRSLAQSQAR